MIKENNINKYELVLTNGENFILESELDINELAEELEANSVAHFIALDNMIINVKNIRYIEIV